MTLVKLTDDVFVNPNEVVTVERLDMSYETPSGGFVNSSFNGSRIILKCGRKLHLNKIMPDEIMAKLNQAEPPQAGAKEGGE